MAEAIGVVASAISLITLLDQIVSGIEKLKALRKTIKTLPHELQDLIEEIELVQGILATLTPDMFTFLDTDSTEKRLLAFAADLDILIAEVGRYSAAAGKGKLGALKIALKREELRVQRTNLDGVKMHRYETSAISYAAEQLSQADSTLQTSYIHRTSILLSRHPAPTLALARNPSLNPITDPKQLEPGNTAFRAPLLVLDKIWTLQTKRLSTGWTFSVRIHNVIPFDSPIFWYTKIGDMQSVQRMFSEKTASPWDCDPHGNNLLNYAAINRRLETCKLLLDSGTDPYLKNNTGHGPRDQVNIAAMVWFTSPNEVPQLIDLYRLFFKPTSQGQDDDLDLLEGLEQDEKHWIQEFRGPPEALTIIQESASLNYAALPLATRFRLAMAMMSGFKRPSVLQTAIAMGGAIPAEAYRLSLDDGQTLLQKMAECMGANLCKISYRGHGKARTPLLAFLEMYTWNWFAIRHARYDFTGILRVWVSEMQSAGVVLEEYGAREAFLYAYGYVDLGFDMYVGTLRHRPLIDDRQYEWLPFRVLGLSYGPAAEDWRHWITNPVDELVGEFWQWAERENEVMPGSWVD